MVSVAIINFNIVCRVAISRLVNRLSAQSRSLVNSIINTTRGCHSNIEFKIASGGYISGCPSIYMRCTTRFIQM